MQLTGVIFLCVMAGWDSNYESTSLAFACYICKEIKRVPRNTEFFFKTQNIYGLNHLLAPGLALCRFIIRSLRLASHFSANDDTDLTNSLRYYKSTPFHFT